MEQESFYEGSFAVFENENLLIEHPYMKDTPVSWLSIIFRNGYLTIHFKNIPIRIEDSRSKELYNSLRQFLVDRGINNPKVSKQDSKYVILGTNKFYEILEVGSIYYNALQEPDFDTLAFSKEVARLFKGRNELYEILISITKSETEKYMTVLANLHNLELNNIVTLFEKKFHSRDSDENDDCFIFTIQSGHNVYLVWESSKMKTATHIFKCDKDTLSLFLRKLQTFIMEDIKNKRSCLDHPEDFYPKELGYYKQLNHVEIKAWEKNLYKALKLRKM